MAEFTEVIKQRNRMCKANENCISCELLHLCGIVHRKPQEEEKIIMKWAKEHPIQTNEDKFEEVFGFKPSKIVCTHLGKSSCIKKVSGLPCDKVCENYDWWNEEYKAPTEEVSE